MALELPEALYAPEQLKACTFEVDRVLGWRRRQDIKRRAGVAETAPDFVISRELAGLVGSLEEVAAMSVAQLEAIQTQLQKWLAQPVTHVTFAVPPTVSTKLAVVSWFRAQVDPTALVKFHVNGNIVGGMVVRTPGKIFDFSFRKQLVKRKSLIPEILKRV